MTKEQPAKSSHGSGRKRVKCEWNKTVTIVVDKRPSRTTFIAHESFLCAHSVFFRCALNGNWKESDKRLVKLLEEDASVFSDWLDFIYGNPITNEAFSDPMEIKQQSEITTEWERLCRIYLMAERLVDIDAKNVAVAAMFDLTHVKDADGLSYLPRPEIIKIVYRKTRDGSIIRKLMVDLWSNIKAPDTELGSESVYKDYPKDFLRGVIIALRAAVVLDHNIAHSKGKEKYLESQD